MRKRSSKKPTAGISRQRFKRLKGHPFVLPVITFMVLFFAAVAGFISYGGTTVGASDVKVINLRLDGEDQALPTRAGNVSQLLDRLDIDLGEQDMVEPDLDTPIQEDMTVSVYTARPVLVVDGEKKIVAFTAEPSPEGVARSVGLSIHPEDKIENVPVDTLSATDVLRDGIVAEQVKIERATVTSLNLYGTTVTVRTHAETVSELLAEKDIQLNSEDTVEPALDTPITANLKIAVVRVGTLIKQIEEEIPPPVEYVEDYNLTLGSTAVREPGQPGKKLVTYEIEQENEVEVARRVIQEIIIEQPVKQVVARGRKAPVVAGNKAEIMRAAGIPSHEFYAADFIISHESGWRVNALNPRGCAGLGQACPGSKLAAVCPNWQSDPVCQMRFFNGYAVGRYGSWSRAFEVWQLQRWW